MKNLTVIVLALALAGCATVEKLCPCNMLFPKQPAPAAVKYVPPPVK